MTTSELRTNGWAPIGAYGLIGDLSTAALVASDGAVDWLATPHIDSPSIFAGLLNPGEGGSINLHPIDPYEVDRRYVEGTLVLETTYTTDTGSVRVTGALNRGSMGRLPWTELARRIDVLDGTVPMTWSVVPGHTLADARPWC